MDSSDSLAKMLPEISAAADKPLAALVDAVPAYHPLARKLRSKGVPVFPSADQAVRSLGRYLCHRVSMEIR